MKNPIGQTLPLAFKFKVETLADSHNIFWIGFLSLLLYRCGNFSPSGSWKPNRSEPLTLMGKTKILLWYLNHTVNWNSEFRGTWNTTVNFISQKLLSDSMLCKNMPNSRAIWKVMVSWGIFSRNKLWREVLCSLFSLLLWCRQCKYKLTYCIVNTVWSEYSIILLSLCVLLEGTNLATWFWRSYASHSLSPR